MSKRTDWTKDEIKSKLATDNAWLIRGLLAIYAGQTQEEKTYGMTKEDNGIGFNALDAEILTAFALQYKQFRRLSPRQIELTRKKLMKYAGQLAKIANGKVAV